MSQPLNPLTLPLSGSWLIEASAGTGKTYTLAALYVRLALGHGPDDGARLPALSPSQILVMTFTEAAAGELRDRIRQRLTGLADWLRRDAPAAEADAFSLGLLASLDAADGLGREQAARRLALAADLLDDAAISTIHSWCLRMLREHALYSGNLFDESLDSDDGARYADSVRDYWRTFVYPLSDADFAAVAVHWATPDQLADALRPLLGELPEPPAVWRGPLALARGRQHSLQEAAALKTGWPERVAELRARFADWQAAKAYNGNRLRAATLAKLLDALEAWASQPHLAQLDDSLDWSRLSPDFLADIWKGDGPPPCEPLSALATLHTQLAALTPFHHGVLAHASQWLGRVLDAHKRREAVMDFDDLLIRLDQALQTDASHPDPEQRGRLAAAIRQQFPAALVDEFQDTDPRQYRILDALYQVAAPHPGTLLAMIGDPKQAIYAFRGGDIFTYLTARAAAHGRHVTLDTNFRSTEAMVARVNAMFARAEVRPGGAFAFADDAGAPLLPFQPVRAAGRRETLHHQGAPLAALQVWLDAEPLNAASYRERMAERCAAQVCALLAGAQAGDTGFADADGGWRALTAADIAILVRDGGEAKSVRAALTRRGIQSVYLSDRDSVFASREAADLLHWLRACAEPTQERWVRAALATATLDLPYARLDAQSEAGARDWDAEVERFVALNACWRRQGVLPMLRQLLHRFDVPARCLARDGGERALTNLLHLAELLHADAELLDGEHALIRRLAERIARPDRGGDERIVRLESDAGLVRVVTIHKSKGLEYPLAMLPFAASYRPVDGARLPAYRYHQKDGDAYRPALSLFKREDERLAQDRERLQEDLRLFYVAVTRARHALWLGIAPLRRGRGKSNTLHESALGHLLNGGAPIDDAAVPALCRDWLDAEHAAASELAWAELDPSLAPARLPPPADAPALAAARACRLRPPAPWRISSYSGLTLRLDAEAAPLAESAHDDVAQEAQADAEREPASAVGGLPALLNALPPGAASGVFVHSLLEWMAHTGFAAVAANPSALRDRVARGCALRQWPQLIDPLTEQLLAWLHTPLGLPGAPATLAGLGAYQAELEFWFAAQQLPLPALDAHTRAMLLPGLPRPALAADTLNGMLKGFADLVLCHDGRYYVVDYKTNWLGPLRADYAPAALAAPLAESRYDLQAAIYLLALHRHLRERLPDYQCERHLGGALYLFLRGWDGHGHGVWHACPSAAEMDALDQLFAGGPA